VVISNIPPKTNATGVPARPFGAVAKYNQKCFERWGVQEVPGSRIESEKDWMRSKHFKENGEKLRKPILNVFAGG